jgi:hypothetical protein
MLSTSTDWPHVARNCRQPTNGPLDSTLRDAPTYTASRPLTGRQYFDSEKELDFAGLLIMSVSVYRVWTSRG